MRNLYVLYSPNIVRVVKSRRMRRAQHVARVGEGIGVYRVLVGKLEGTRPLGRPRHRWEDNIKMDLQEVGCGGMDCFRRQFLRKMWSLLFTSFHTWSSYIWPVFEASSFQHHTKLYFKCSTLLVSSLNLSPIYWLKDSSSYWKLHLPWQSWISFPVYILHQLLTRFTNRWNIPHSPAVFDVIQNKSLLSAFR
jgi:hypothetical protein